MPNFHVILRAMFFIALGYFFVFGAIGLTAAAPDRHLASFEHRELVGLPLEHVTETLSAKGLAIGLARFYSHAGPFCDHDSEYSCFLSVYVQQEDWGELVANCEWECIFLRASYKHISNDFWWPVVHRYEYLFVIENELVVSSHNVTSTWSFPFYL